MTAADVAFLFPGQGAHCAHMLDGARDQPGFAARYAVVRELLGGSPIDELRHDPGYVNANAVSSLLTVLASAVALDRHVACHGLAPRCVAGYSVGQWTALYAAGCVEFDVLARIVKRRADFMDDCVAGAPGGMMAVIGVRRDALEALCERLREEGQEIYVSNVNCPGQYSLSGRASAIDLALDRVAALRPKVATRLPVSNGWHSPLLERAATRFTEYLATVDLRPPRVPVVDNVTGEFLPGGVEALKAQLGRHLAMPVQWERGLRTLVAHGCRALVELGFGNVLTKFGFFVDRSVSHVAFGPSS